jgi:hypothetical protein
MRVITGFGYIKDDKGNIIAKAQLPAGEHTMKAGFEYVEVADSAALEAVAIYKDPAVIQQGQNEKLIQDKIRQTAIDALKSEHALPADYDDKNPIKT